jgi:hypothetical protein
MLFWLFSFLAHRAGANPNTFQAIVPGAPTGCMGGEAYAFMFRKGTVNKLVVEFEGGGACWNDITCAIGTAKSSVDVKGTLSGLNSGIHDGTNPKNPVAEWNHLYVPYCTADVHAGNQTVKYGFKTVQHFGFVNAKTAVEYAYKVVPNPSDVFTTGCSAGSLGSIIWAPYVMDHYKGAKNTHMGDSYVGVLAQNQWNAAVKNWGFQHALAPFIPAYAPDKILGHFERDEGAVLLSGATQYPPFAKNVFSYQTSNADAVQSAFFLLGGGNILNWTKIMRWQKDEMHDEKSKFYSPNFGSFVHKGSEHCVTGGSGFYSTTSSGVALVDFVSDLLAGKTADVDCEPHCGILEPAASEPAADPESSPVFWWRK